MLTVGSVCSGLGGFDLAFERQGFTVKWQVEIDKNCQKLLKAKYPHAELHTDLTKFKPKDSDAVSVIVGGTPCQDLSVAGQREGLDGKRSGLFFDMVRLCKKLRPRIIEWENVPGALSSNEGRDFARVIRAFTGLKVEIPREGWGNAGFVRTPYPGGRWNIAWRVLDAQYFGVAQRRKRLFLIGSLGNASCLKILFEPESVCGDNPPSREKGQGIAPTLASRTKGGGGLGTDFDLDGGLVPVSGAVSSKWSKGTGGPAGDECYNLVAHTLRAEHDASEDGTGRGTPLVFHPTQDPIHSTDGTTHALSCGSKNGSSSVAIAIPIQEIGKRQSGGEREGVCHGKEGDPMFSLQASAQHGVAVSLAIRGRAGGSEVELGDDKANAILTPTGGSDGAGAIMRGMAIRRLTERECERLMGLPDNHTEGFSGSVRYKMLGNSVVINVVEWIAKRIKAALT